MVPPTSSRIEAIVCELAFSPFYECVLRCVVPPGLYTYGFAPAAALESSPCRGRLRHRQRRAGKRGDDLLAVKAAIFDENFAGVDPADDHAGEIQTGNIALERLRIESGFIGLRIELHAELAQEIEIGMVAGENKDLHGGQESGSARA